jgi:hypothetical protein
MEATAEVDPTDQLFAVFRIWFSISLSLGYELIPFPGR